MVICPIMSQATESEGDVVYLERVECIRAECHFYNIEEEECYLLLSSQETSTLIDRVTNLETVFVKDLQRSTLELHNEVGGLTNEVQRIDESLKSVGEMAASEEAVSMLVDKLSELDKNLNFLLERVDKNIVESQNETKSLGRKLAETEGHFASFVNELQERLDKITELSETTAKGAKSDSSSLKRSLTEIKKLTKEISEASEESKSKLDEALISKEIQSMITKGLEGINTKAEEQLNGIKKLGERISASIADIKKDTQAEASNLKHFQAEKHNNRGVSLYYKGAFESAVEELKQAIELRDDFAEAYNNLGLAYSELNKTVEATEAFKKAIELEPKLGEAYNNLGFLYHSNSDYEKAVEMFSESLNHQANSTVAYTNLGNGYYELKRYTDAIKAWEKALEVDPFNENARRNLEMFQQRV